MKYLFSNNKLKRIRHTQEQVIYLIVHSITSGSIGPANTYLETFENLFAE
jgi:hypothetical protein